MNSLKRAVERSVTVGELIEQLQDFDAKLPVVFAYNYGDHWNTEVAEVVREADEGSIVWSDYHRQPKTVDESDDDDESLAERETVKAVVIKGGR